MTTPKRSPADGGQADPDVLEQRRRRAALDPLLERMAIAAVQSDWQRVDAIRHEMFQELDGLSARAGVELPLGQLCRDDDELTRVVNILERELDLITLRDLLQTPRSTLLRCRQIADDSIDLLWRAILAHVTRGEEAQRGP